MGCWYGFSAAVRFKGRLVRVTICVRGTGHLLNAWVEKGKPLPLEEESADWMRLQKLVLRDKATQDRIQQTFAKIATEDF